MDRWRRPQFIALALWALVALLTPALASICAIQLDCRLQAATLQCPCQCDHSKMARGQACCHPVEAPSQPLHHAQAAPASSDNTLLLTKLCQDADSVHVIATRPIAPRLLHRDADFAVAADTAAPPQYAPQLQPGRAPPL